MIANDYRQRALAEVHALQRAGRLAEAERLCRDLLRQSPEDPEALYFLGLLLGQSARFGEAVEILHKASARLRKQPQVIFHLAEAQRLAGLPDEAEKSYRQALKLKPDFFEAHANLGALLQSRGQLAAAAQELERAHRLNPRAAPVLISLSGLGLETGEPERSLAFARKAAALAPNMPESRLAVGNALAATGDFDAAITAYEQALQLNPALADAHLGAGVARKAKGDINGAVEAYEQAWRIEPNNFKAHNNLANCLSELGEDERAKQHYMQALALKPDFPDALCGMAKIMEKQSDPAAAMECYEKALVADPGLKVAKTELASLAINQKRPQRALDLYRALLEEDPENDVLLLGVGNALIHCHRLEEARLVLEKALVLRPDWGEVLNALGAVESSMKQFSRAIEYYAAALEIEPDHALAHSNMGAALSAIGDAEAAVRHFESAISINPEQAAPHFGLAMLLLGKGNFGRGWKEYEWRLKATEGVPYAWDPCRPGERLPRPSSYLPVDFSGKRFFMLSDQGIGDELFFLRLAAEFKRRGAWLAYQATPRIQALLAGRVGQELTLAPDGCPMDIDHAFLASEAPLVLGVQDGDALPPPLPLAPQREPVTRMQERLAGVGQGPFLGVTWRAGTSPEAGNIKVLFKEIPLHELARAVQSWPGQVLILQRNPAPGEIEKFEAALGRPVHDFSLGNENLEEMLALLSLLDEYVGVSNTNMHLAAGVGKPCRVLVPLPPEWRWMEEGDESPWFPGFRIYRQLRDQTWDEALARLAQDLNR